jgi:hypothetical protein
VLTRGIENGMGKRWGGVAHRMAEEERGSGMGSGNAVHTRSASSNKQPAAAGTGWATRHTGAGEERVSGAALSRGPSQSKESGPDPVCTVQFLIYSKFSKLI